MTKTSNFAPAAWESELQAAWDDIADVADRQGSEAAKLAAKRARYAVRTFIEEGFKPVTQPKNTRGQSGFAEETAATRRPPTKSTAEIVAEANRAAAFAQEVLERVKPTTTTTTEDAGATFDRLTRQYAEQHQVSYGDAAVAIGGTAEGDRLYAMHSADAMHGRTALPPPPAAPPLATDRVSLLAIERAARTGETFERAYSELLNEDSSLYNEASQ
jgi:hypothetical protein